MKLSKDQKQKIALGAMLLVFVIYASIEFLIGPAQTEREQALKNAEAMEPKIKAAKVQIMKTKELENKLPDTEKLANQVKSMIPEGSAVAWFPPRVAEYFKRQGVDKLTARPNSEVAEKDLPEFQRMNWGLEIPRAEFVPLGKAIAELENGEPLMEIQGIDIEVNRDDVQVQRVNITINNLVRK